MPEFNPALTVFKTAKDTVAQSQTPLSELIAAIAAGNYAETIRRVQALLEEEDGEEKYRKAKPSRIPAFMAAATSVKGHRKKDVQALTGIMPFDRDHLDDAGIARLRAAVTDLPCCAFFFVSPSGAGVKFGVRRSTTEAAYKRHWLATAAWLEREASIGFDAKDLTQHDCSRLTFVSRDPAAFVNLEAEEAPVDCPEEPVETQLPEGNEAKVELPRKPMEPQDDNLHEAMKLRSALALLPHLADDRNRWIAFGMALHTWNRGKLGFRIWSDWSRSHPHRMETPESVYLEKWNNDFAHRTPVANPITIGSIFAEAGKEGWSGVTRYVDPPDPPPTPETKPKPKPKIAPVTLTPVEDIKNEYLESKPYWMQKPPGVWYYNKEHDAYKVLSSGDFKAYIEVNYGFSRKKVDGNASSADRKVVWIQKHRIASFVGCLAGYWKGVYRIDGETAIIVGEPPIKLITAQGEFPTIKRILEVNFDKDQVQEAVFNSWCKLRLESMMRRHWQASQILGLCGPADTGKSLIQRGILTPLFGGREADGEPFLHSMDQFNGDVGMAEHVFLEDTLACGSQRERDRLAQKVKNFCVSQKMRIRLMQQNPFISERYQGLTMTLNDDYKSLWSAPAMLENFEDKMILLKCSNPGEIGRDGLSVFERKELILSELPAYRHFLLNVHEIAPDMRNDRYGVCSYHNEEIKRTLDSMSEPVMYLDFVDTVDKVRPNTLPIEKQTSAEIRTLFQDLARTSEPVQDLLVAMPSLRQYLSKEPMQLGGMLSQLELVCARDGSLRVTSVNHGGYRKWTIHPKKDHPTKTETCPTCGNVEIVPDDDPDEENNPF